MTDAPHYDTPAEREAIAQAIREGRYEGVTLVDHIDHVDPNAPHGENTPEEMDNA